MKKHNKKIIIALLLFTIFAGIYGFSRLSSAFFNSFQNVVAHDEIEEKDSISSSVSESEESTSETESAVLTYEDTTYAVSAGGNSQALSGITDVSELQKEIQYTITTYDEWKKLYDFSQKSTLENMTFLIYYPNGTLGSLWNLNANSIGTGIGSTQYPFSGTIQPYYDGMIINTTVPLFHTLSSKAKIGSSGNTNPLTIGNTINNSVSEAGGLASNYVIESSEVYIGGTQSNITNLHLIGTIKTKETVGTVGGLFGKVTKSDDIESVSLYLSRDEKLDLSDITLVEGTTAGGLFGEVSGEITILLNSMPSLASKVYVKELSNIAGLNTDVCSGGLIGKIKDQVVFQTTNTELMVIGNEVAGNGISGGVVGMIENSTFTASKIQKDSVIKEGQEPFIYGKYVCGGFIGMADSSKIKVSDLILNVDVKTYYYEETPKCFAASGGVIGRYVTAKGDTTSFLDISNIKTGNDQRNDNKVGDTTQKIMVLSDTSKDFSPNTGGGIIGSCNGNKVKIHDIKFDPGQYNVSLIYSAKSSESDISTNQSTGNESISGGIAGSLSGLQIEISKITFNFQHNSGTNGKDGIYSNSLGGYCVGNIAGLVGRDGLDEVPTKIKVSNIVVQNNYIHKAMNYHGGLFGYVSKGAIIALAETVDLSKVPFLYQNGKPKQDWSAEAIVMLAPQGYRGFVAGYAEECLIYYEVGATVTRSIKRNENGELESNIDGVDLGPDNGANFRYCIDDIGNAGTIFRNVEENGIKVIQYENHSYGTEVTGKLEKNEDGTYRISSLGDALRLAIAGQAYDRSTDQKQLIFASDCFGEGATIETLLSANYQITTDLNLGDANIQSFLRNDSDLSFSGSMEGVKADNKNPLITIDSISRHINGGLYPHIKGATFKNLSMDGKLYYHPGEKVGNTIRGGSGVIAAIAEGSCTFDNIEISTLIKGDMYPALISNDDTNLGVVSWNNTMYSHGGLIGEYRLEGGTLTVTNCNISPTIQAIRANCFVGGMIGRVDTSKNGNIVVQNSTIGTKITTDSNYLNLKSYGNKFHGRTSGMIAYIGNTYKNVTSIYGGYGSKPADIKDKTYVKMKIDDIQIKDAMINLSGSKNEYMNITGGLLGYAWCNAEVSMNKITVEGCSINSLGYVGGLVSFVAGKFDVSDITLNSFIMKAEDGNKPRSYSGLLFGDGECAFITLDQSSYHIPNPNNISVSGYSTFDEIVGVNVERNHDATTNKFNEEIIPEYRHGGILNIINTGFNFTAGSYDSYENRVWTSANKYTRYYYNLFPNTDESSDSWKIANANQIVIDSPQKLMTWHVGNYANETLNRFMVPYFSGKSDYRKVKTVKLSGDLDMNGYSLYPTCVDDISLSGEANTTITLYGETISNLEESLKTSEKSKIYRSNDLITNKNVKNITQHYLMHASLLYCVNNAKVSNVILKGTIANNGIKSGSVIGGYATGGVNISNITFSGLKISHYSELSDDRCGLMLSWVGVKRESVVVDSNAKIEKIIMTDYVASDKKSAAASLIAKVGNNQSQNIQISFKDMKLLDEKASSPFEYSSFIYEFDYSDDSKDNKSYGIYTFNYEDTVDKDFKRDDHNVTYGDEIKEGLNYNDYVLVEIPMNQDNPLKEAIEEANRETYIPYIFKQTKGIYVNPKNGNITEGCGTYEDPYIIKDIAQFLTLYCYLSGEDDIYRFLFRPGDNDDTAWNVVPIGGDGNGESCSKTENSHTPAIYGKSDNFPSVDDMRTAYYRIEKDIDLGSVKDVNYSTLLKQFSGLGSYKYPFSGVIIGNKNNGICPIITLPTPQSAYNFSFIEYMQGAVVKDLVIQNTTGVVISNSAGGVASVILGGDNIIDHVSCTLNLKVQDAIDGVGGYVGVIENGSLILRNIPETAIKDSNIQSHDDQYYYTSTDANKTLTAKNKIGLLVGSVKDGFVLYENPNISNRESKKVFTNADLNVTGKNEVLSLISGFQLINGACLDEASGVDDSRIAITLFGNNYTVNISNEDQLEIMALALNSDSLSVYIDSSHADAEQGIEHLSGYDYTAKCRKALYNEVGTQAAKEGTSIDCIFARSYDDGKGENANFAYPYLCYKYMEFSNENTATENDTLKRYGNYKNTLFVDETSSKVISKLNKADDFVKAYTTTYYLSNTEPDYLYDLSAYGNSFRGFGGLYSKEYSDFRANFDGNNHQVKIKMDRDWTSDIYITGMFNSLIYDNVIYDNVTANEVRTPLEIKNLIITDSTFQNTKNQEMIKENSEDDLLMGAARGAATGALAGEVQGIWTFSNIQFQRTTTPPLAETRVNLKSVLNSEDYSKELICGVRGYMNVGGLIGRVNVTESKDAYGDADMHNGSNKIVLKNCSVNGIDSEQAVNIQAGADAFAVGGLIGSVGANINTKGYTSGNKFFYFGDVTFQDCSVGASNVLAIDSGFLGGFAGTVGYRPARVCRSIGSVHVTGSGNFNVNQVQISSGTQNDTYDKYSAGGIFGQIEVLAIKPLDADSEGHTWRNTDIDSVTAESSIENISVNDVSINIQSTNYSESDKLNNVESNSNGIGGLIGYLNCRKMEIKDVLVKDSFIGCYEEETTEDATNKYAKTNVGGLIGISKANGEWGGNNLSFYTNFLEIKSAKVEGSKIISQRDEASAGGFIGYISTDVVRITGDNNNPSKVLNNEIYTKGAANVGGVVGEIYPTNYAPTNENPFIYMVAKKSISKIEVLGNNIETIEGLYAGGLVGEFRANKSTTYDSQLYLGDIQVGKSSDNDSSGSNTIVSKEYAGGLCGYVPTTYTKVIYLESQNDTEKISVDSNTIVARCAGGLYGKLQTKYEIFETNQIEILRNQIIACSYNSGNATMSGGAIGVRNYDNTATKSATYAIKENVIVATGQLSNNSFSSIGCGGVLGMVTYSGNQQPVQYFNQMELENNSIGYFRIPGDVSIKSFNDAVSYLKTVDLNYKSQNVFLLPRENNKLTYKNWRDCEINESNVGTYANRIGTFFGDYSNLQCVILRPSVTYSNEVGSIPAVDVGQSNFYGTASPSEYGYSHPYTFKEKCHIIYLDDYESSDNQIDISKENGGINPVLDTSVLKQHNSDNTNPEYETEYFFGNVEKDVSDYSSVKYMTVGDLGVTQEEATYAFLTSKRLNITMGGNTNENLICASPDLDDYFSKTYVKDSYNGVPVIEVDGQSAQYIGDYVAAILTNGGGVAPNHDNTVFNNMLEVSIVNAYIDPTGKISAIDTNAPEDIRQTHAQSSIVAMENNQLSSEGRPFDAIIDTNEGSYYTISLLRYTYKSYKYDGTSEEKETIYIPVFVTKKVTLNSYLSILEGEEYSFDEVLNNGHKDQVVISHDSVYTMYSEFVYDEVRNEEAFKNLKIEKTLKFETIGSNGSYVPIKIQPGTKFTLVDAQTGEEYYYTASEESVSEIPFSDFKNAGGAGYTQRKIGDITITETDYKSIGFQGVADSQRDTFVGEVGIERYFIVVEPSGKDNNMSFRVSIATKVENESNQSKEELVRKFLDEGTKILHIYGPLISFEGVSTNSSSELVGKDGITEIQGKISKEESLKVDGRIRVSLSLENETNSNRGLSPYWSYKAKGNTIDSSNAGKYLEIGVTLIDNETNQEVNWPEGTNVVINDGTPIPLQGNSVVYAYKDNEKEFAFDTVSHNIADGEWYYYDISDGSVTPNYQWITKGTNDTWYYEKYTIDGNGNVTFSKESLADFTFQESNILVSNQCHLEFDFSVADIKDYAGKNYTVKMNLYRSSDPSFPLEEAGMEILDGSIREYSKTIQGVGQYDLAAAITPDDLMDLGINLYGNTKTIYEIPFTNQLDFSNLISNNEDKKSQDIEKCARNNYMITYRIYKKTKQSNGSYQYELVNLDDINLPFTLYEVNGTETGSSETIVQAKEIIKANAEKEYVYQTSKQFTAEEITAGTEQTPYVTSWKMKLSIDTGKLTDDDLANYKIEATYVPYTEDMPSTDEASTLKDYFIFTIAKLKTDF